MIRRTRKGTSCDVVADVRQQVEQAAALARISGQDRLDDPRLNPAVRDLADQLRDERHRQLLRDAHRRGGRQIRVLDQRAESAARALTLIQQAREATSPAQSVLALHNGRQRAMTAALGASIALMVGAATGVAALAESWGTHGAAGYVAEVGMTGLSTAAILVRSHLARHGYRVTGWQSRALWALAIVPMLASIAANAAAAGPIGIACSIGAAAFAGLAHLIADSYGDAIQARASEVTRADEAELRAVALGEDITPAPAAPVPADAPEGEGQGDDGETRVVLDESAETIEITDRSRPVPEVRAEDAVQAYEDTVNRAAAAVVAEAESLLRGPDDDDPDGGTAAGTPPPTGPAPMGASDDDAGGREHIGSAREGHIEAREGHIEAREGGHIGRDQRDSLTRAHEARRDAGNETRRRVAEYLAEHPGASNAQIGRALGRSESTIKRARRQLRQEQREAAE